MKKIVILIAVFLVSILLFIWKFHFFTIDKLEIEVKNAACVSEEDIRSDSGLMYKNIFFLNINKIKSDLLQKYICIKTVQLTRSFPKTVKLILEGRSAFVKVVPVKIIESLSLNNLEATPSTTAALLNWSLPTPPAKTFLADETGFLFKESDEGGLPVLFLPMENFKIGQQLDSYLFKKVEVVFGKLEEMHFGDLTGLPVTAKVSGETLLIKSPQKLVLSLQKDLLRQLASLQLIFQKAKINSETMDVVDLRFDKPVITYSVKK